jgi:hypothetical protein
MCECVWDILLLCLRNPETHYPATDKVPPWLLALLLQCQVKRLLHGVACSTS